MTIHNFYIDNILIMNHLRNIDLEKKKKNNQNVIIFLIYLIYKQYKP